jgi:hypothetical protein
MSLYAGFLGHWPRGLGLIAEAWWELAVASWNARRASRGTRRVRDALGVQIGEISEDAAEMARAVARACRCHVKPMRCLERSLALCRMLRRRDIAATVRIGCRQDGQGWRFHAWVEDGRGRPIGSEHDKSKFRTLMPEHDKVGALARLGPLSGATP